MPALTFLERAVVNAAIMGRDVYDQPEPESTIACVVLGLAAQGLVELCEDGTVGMRDADGRQA